jgi:DNA transformation protein
LGDISSKKMFGGYGVFEEGKMFALVNSAGGVFLKAAAEADREKFIAAGCAQHGRMPYFQLPDAVLADDDQLLAWAGEAIRKSKG